jgi:hypothetical protein
MWHLCVVPRHMSRQKRHDEGLKHTSVRISDLHKFAMRAIARSRGESDSVAVERALETEADNLALSRSWRELWDPEESVRTLALWGLPEFKPATKEHAACSFVVAHAQFFYSDKARNLPHRARAIILWPHLDEMEHLWRTTKHEDYWAAAKEMAKLLRKAKLDAPLFG